MSELEKLLDDVTQEVAQRVSEDDDFCEDALADVLKRRLLPLLEAGQAMRNGIGAYAVALNAKPFVQADTMAAIRDCVRGLEAWDVAKPLTREAANAILRDMEKIVTLDCGCTVEENTVSLCPKHYGNWRISLGPRKTEEMQKIDAALAAAKSEQEQP